MSWAMSALFFFLGIVWAVAGKDIMQVLACFLIYAILSGVYQIQELRKDMEDNDYYDE